MNRYTQFYNLIQQVEFGDNREHIGQALLDFSALALKEGLPFATQYGALEAGRALDHVAKTDAKQLEFGFNAETYGRARGLLDVAREALRHAMWASTISARS